MNAKKVLAQLPKLRVRQKLKARGETLHLVCFDSRSLLKSQLHIWFLRS